MRTTYRVLTGPTASGKTSWLLARARSGRLAVVSADSRQVYRHMDIGTGKPTHADRQILPHHGIDCLEPGMKYSAHRFLTQAALGLAEVRREGRTAWVCGGTGLYIRALVEELNLGEGPRPRLRAALEQRVAESSARAVAVALSLDVTDPDNRVRVVRSAELACRDRDRALRIYGWLGLPSELAALEGRQDSRGAERRPPELRRWRCLGIAVLDPGRDALAERIEERTRLMFESGLVDEVARLRHLGYGEVAVVREGIGYREAGQVLGGQLSVAEAITRTAVRTRQYAKRQRTYFRGRGWPFMGASELDQWEADSKRSDCCD